MKKRCLLALALASCAAGPELLPDRVHAALQSGRVSEALPLVTVASRPYLLALAAARGPGVIGFGPLPQPSAIRKITAQGSRLVLEVAAGNTAREWVLVNEDGQWRIDLLETSVRRPWNL